jgi:hypothetical protein
MRLEYKPQFFDDLEDIAEYVAECFSVALAREVVQNKMRQPPCIEYSIAGVTTSAQFRLSKKLDQATTI